MKKDLHDAFLITHKNCLDGTACAALFMAAGGKRKNIYFCNPDHETMDEFIIDLVIRKGEYDIFVVDVSISSKAAMKLDSLIHGIVLLDHHKSAIPLSSWYFCDIEVKNKRCGSKMFFDWLCKQEQLNNLFFYSFEKFFQYKRMVEYVDDNDRWVHNIPESRKLASLHKILGQEMFLDRIIKNPWPDFMEKEKYLLEVYDKKREIETEKRKESTQVYTKNIQGHDVRVGFVIAYGDDQSLLGEALYTDLDLDVDIAVIINGDGVSLRCSRDCPVDVSEVAKLNGGGGHPKASGCSLGNVLGQNFLEFVASKMRF